MLTLIQCNGQFGVYAEDLRKSLGGSAVFSSWFPNYAKEYEENTQFVKLSHSRWTTAGKYSGTFFLTLDMALDIADRSKTRNAIQTYNALVDLQHDLKNMTHVHAAFIPVVAPDESVIPATATVDFFAPVEDVVATPVVAAAPVTATPVAAPAPAPVLASMPALAPVASPVFEALPDFVDKAIETLNDAKQAQQGRLSLLAQMEQIEQEQLALENKKAFVKQQIEAVDTKYWTIIRSLKTELAEVV